MFVSNIMFFDCEFQIISIKLQLGYFDLLKQKQLTNTIKHDNMIKNMICEKNKLSVFANKLFICFNIVPLFYVLFRIFYVAYFIYFF